MTQNVDHFILCLCKETVAVGNERCIGKKGAIRLDNNCRNPYYRNRMHNPCQNIENNRREMRKDCCHTDNQMDGMSLAMAYVPWQHWKETYEPCKALSIGTIFPELNLPLMERSCVK